MMWFFVVNFCIRLVQTFLDGKALEFRMEYRLEGIDYFLILQYMDIEIFCNG